MRKGQYDVAEAHLIFGLSLAPRNLEMLTALAEIRQRRNPVDGLAAWEDVLVVDSRNWLARLCVGEIMVHKSEFAKAKDVFTSLVQERPADGRALLDLARIQALAKPEEAIAAAERASHDKDQEIAGEANELLEALKETLSEGDPGYTAQRVGVTLLRQYQPQLALSAFAEAGQRRPDDLDVQAYQALAKQQSGDLEAAAAQLRSILVAKPDHALSHYLLGLVLRSQSHLPEAITEFRHAIALGGEDPNILADLAQTHLLEGDYGAAEEQFRRAASLRPGDLAAVLRLAHFYLDRGFRTDRGLEAATVAAALQPSNAEARDLVGWALHLNDRSGDGLVALREAIALDRQDATAYYHLGVVLEHNQDRKGAEEAYRRASDLAGADPVGSRADQALRDLLR